MGIDLTFLIKIINLHLVIIVGIKAKYAVPDLESSSRLGSTMSSSSVSLPNLNRLKLETPLARVLTKDLKFLKFNTMLVICFTANSAFDLILKLFIH